MTDNDALLAYVTRVGDNALILGQRMVEIVTLYPELEEELANANFALDYIGQARLYYSYAAELEGQQRDEDAFAFLRDGHEFRNVLLVEQPNGDFGEMVTRQFLFESFYHLQLDALQHCSDARLAEIAARAIREVAYHLRHARQWILRLGDGTEESHARVQGSVDHLWPYTGEMFAADEIDRRIQSAFLGPDLDALLPVWQQNVRAVLKEATLDAPGGDWMASGGKQGRHSEHLGYLIAEMQFLQRAYPGATW